MTSNFFLNDLLLRNPEYVGTYSCNNIPIPRNSRNFMVINLSKVNTPGSHFVSMYIFRNKQNKWLIEYMDPLGAHCTNSDILFFMKNYCTHYKYLKFPIQPIFSVRCGLYCAGFVISRIMKKSSINKYANIFSNDLKHNDEIIDKFILKNIK